MVERPLLCYEFGLGRCSLKQFVGFTDAIGTFGQFRFLGIVQIYLNDLLNAVLSKNGRRSDTDVVQAVFSFKKDRTWEHLLLVAGNGLNQ